MSHASAGLGRGEPVTLATTVTMVTGISGATRLLLLQATTSTIVYVETIGTADGAALPSTGRLAIPASAMPVEIDISRYGSIGLAGDVIGSVEVEFS